MVGGIEVAWQAQWQRWLLHAHALAVGVDADAWEQLEAASVSIPVFQTAGVR